MTKEEEIFSNEIRISHLKKIDKIFNKGLNYYLDPTELKKNKEASIFFRKTKFDTELNIGARKIVNHFEDLKISLSAIAKITSRVFSADWAVFSSVFTLEMLNKNFFSSIVCKVLKIKIV